MEIIKLEPADVLVVHEPTKLNQTQHAALMDHLRQAFGDNRRVLVLDDGATVSIVRKPAAPVSEMAVKVEIDKTMIGKVLEPGCMLLSPDAVAQLIERTGLTTADLEGMGAIPHVGEDEPVGQMEPHVWLWPGDVGADQMPYGHHPDGRVALRVDDLTDAQRRMPVVMAQLAKLQEGNT